MVDNRYLNWSYTVPPDTDAATYKAIRFSKRLESMCKDVECFFGIMNGRFCILRYGLRFQTMEDCDKAWLTCCYLHNMFLEIDCLHKDWEHGHLSDWERFDADHLLKDSHMNMTTPFAFARLNFHPSENDTATKINSK